MDVLQTELLGLHQGLFTGKTIRNDIGSVLRRLSNNLKEKTVSLFGWNFGEGQHGFIAIDRERFNYAEFFAKYQSYRCSASNCWRSGLSRNAAKSPSSASLLSIVELSCMAFRR